MAFYQPLGWRQLAHEKKKLLAAVAGIAFAVTLMLMQLGFKDALFVSATLLHRNLGGELVLISPLYEAMLSTEGLPERRLQQALAMEEVVAVAPIRWTLAGWKNPWTQRLRSILVIGFDPNTEALQLPDIRHHQSVLQLPRTLVFDTGSRAEYGPVAEEVRSGRELLVELQKQDFEVVGLTQLGSSFVADGNVIVSTRNYARLFPELDSFRMDAGVIKLRPGADVPAVQARLAAVLPADTQVLTRSEFVQLETDFWARATPIGFVFLLGTVVGFIVGAVTVYQILYTDVSHHLSEYATLKAMGWSSAALSRVVIDQALFLSVLGFVPGFLAALVIYHAAVQSTGVPMAMTGARAATVLGLSLLMSVISALLALRQVHRADPAEVF
ncbi:MAG: ABC transporter permease [Verrucomicrobiaceae bacterium]|nr:ABC transporter permease [Verrucomicrobiaceae bacterium]